tara:strand:- start:111 stop:311 length:201 start_codon:yes stop_codon:yes gene_type:complete
MNWFSKKLTELQNMFYNKTQSNNPVNVTEDLNSFTVAQLRVMAKDRGLSGYTQLRKAQLIEMIQQN